MASIVFALSCAAIAAPTAGPDPDPVLKAIENRYNHAQSLKLDFSETYIASRRPTQNETGVLYLRKPGRMRWEYTSPAGKVFLADGKDTWLYTPDGQIHKVRVTSQNQSKLEYAFSNEQLNAPVALGLFVFRPPAGVQIVEAENQ